MTAEIHIFPGSTAARGRSPDDTHLPPGGGGGTFDGMEARVGRLEEEMKGARSDLTALRVDVAEIKGKISNLPTAVQITDLAVSIASLKTKVEGLPSMAKLSTLLGVIAILWALMPKIQAGILAIWP